MRAVDMVGVALWGSKAEQRADELATLTGERDAALRECAELRATVAGLEARLATAQADAAFYRAAFCDEFKAHQGAQ